ncbi:MAG: hypothetical protein HKN29_12495 [Rhodothermales bacterium]|nr:hypothetical protein [Rhodothermales bacterium]
MTRFATPTLLLAVLLLSGCYQTAVMMDNEPSQRVERVRVDKFLGGLLPRTQPVLANDNDPIEPSEPLLAEDLCDGREVHKVETFHSFWNSVLASVTFSIYTPVTVRVTCATR